jgi:hypothetical protein
VRHFIGAARVTAVAGKLKSIAGVLAILAAILAVFGRWAIARRMCAFLLFRHIISSFDTACFPDKSQS